MNLVLEGPNVRGQVDTRPEPLPMQPLNRLFGPGQLAARNQDHFYG